MRPSPKEGHHHPLITKFHPTSGPHDPHQAWHIVSNFHYPIYDISYRLVRLETILSRYDTLGERQLQCCVFCHVRQALLAIKGENIDPDCHKNSILTVRGGLVPHQLYVEVENVCHCSHFHLKFCCFASYEGHIYRLEFAYMKHGNRFTVYRRLKYDFRNSTATCYHA